MSAHGRMLSMEAEKVAAETHNVPVWKPWGAWLGAILYFAFLAYPHPSEKGRRLAFAQALKAYLVKNCGAKRKAIPPAYRKLKSEKITDAINMGFRRIAMRRMTAGKMAYILCINGVAFPYRNPKPGGPVGVVLRSHVHTVNKVAKAFVEYGEQRGRHVEEDSALANFKHRIWAESLPVLHLAIALWHELPEWEEACMSGRDRLVQVLLGRIWITDWLERALTYAEGLRVSEHVHNRIPAFAPERAICLRPLQNPSEPFGL